MKLLFIILPKWFLFSLCLITKEMDAELSLLNNAFKPIAEFALNTKLPKEIEVENAEQKLISSIDYFLNLGFTINEDETYQVKKTMFLKRQEIKPLSEKLNFHNDKKNIAVLIEDYPTAAEERDKAIEVWREIRRKMQLAFYKSENFFVMDENQSILFVPLDIPSGAWNYDDIIRCILERKE